MKKNYFTFLLISMFVLSFNAQTVITQWDFNAGDPDGVNPSTGSGTISTIGDVTNPSFNTGNGSSDPTQSGLGYQTTTYPSQSTANLTAGIQVNASTVGYNNIIFKFDLRASNTASRWYQIQYSTNGTDFVNFEVPVRLGGDADVSVGDAWSNELTADFSSIPAANDNANFAVRVVSSFSTVAFTEYNSNTDYAANSAYESARNRTTGSQSNYGGGTWRFDMVTLSGTSLSTSSFELNKLRVYPNPSIDGIVNFNQNLSGDVFDIRGLKVLNFVDTNQIRLDNNSKGIYFIKTTEGSIAKVVLK